MFFDYNIIKSEINNKNKYGKYPNTHKVSITILYNLWIKAEITKEIRKSLELNENKNKIYQNLWDAANIVLRKKFIALNAYL